MNRERRGYPYEFKIESVKRYLENGRRAKYTADELGIPESTLREWRDKYMTEIKKETSPVPVKQGKKEFESILQEKEKRIQQLEEEVQILKKSIGIFTKDSRQK
ncbi:hypothetical protein EHQ68_09290 [Leptospira congkakensis]|uniref:Uncharacterized protein n=1 Tax=Leptospira congkakensis TaxID=2484932 RepID=A0A4Z1AIE4_9LEPT|nr:transposase [Leptospira congkakensis]TGL88043.1 hypothetical protein EHQ69_15375 [Leptospira congkakensis]TGL88964.1 hypothetical protein EHQ68_09290 [Leptospira congkakensis]TGL96981.1 hypothetical protein EHQ70_08770 [Leptospira congkakensis]